MRRPGRWLTEFCGSPEGYSKGQPWHNSAFERDGSLRSDYMTRMEQMLDEADRRGTAVIHYNFEKPWNTFVAAISADGSTRSSGRNSSPTDPRCR
jgi:hypothetical protein